MTVATKMTQQDKEFFGNICAKESIVDRYPSSDPYELDLLEWYIKEIRSGVTYDKLIEDINECMKMFQTCHDECEIKLKVLHWMRDNKILDELEKLPKIEPEFPELNYPIIEDDYEDYDCDCNDYDDYCEFEIVED